MLNVFIYQPERVGANRAYPISTESSDPYMYFGDTAEEALLSFCKDRGLKRESLKVFILED